MKKLEIVYADPKSEKILSKNFWKLSDFNKTEGGTLVFPFSAPTERKVFPVELASKDQAGSLKGNYFIVIKYHPKLDKLKYEFNKLSKAHEMGVSVKPLAMKVGEKGGGYLYTLIEKNTIPLLDINFEKLKPEEREGLFKLVGSTVRKWHEMGFYHGDLAPRNILVKIKQKPEIIAVDLEKSLIQKLSPINIQKDLDFFEYQARRVGATNEDILNFKRGYERKKTQKKDENQFKLF
jgi:tRNA A-37 threonylcarbamoyl transferase component Bud32